MKICEQEQFSLFYNCFVLNLLEFFSHFYSNEVIENCYKVEVSFETELKLTSEKFLAIKINFVSGMKLDKRIEEAVPTGQQLQELGMRLRCLDEGSSDQVSPARPHSFKKIEIN